MVAYALVVLAFLGGVGYPSVLAANAMKAKLLDATYQPSWYTFLAATCLLAFVLGIAAGESNYSTAAKSYNLGHLSHYEDIDPSHYLGQQLMDAGRIEFR